MSFQDFQQMWYKKFPDSSLSEEWEEDVKLSLSSHRQKILDLKDELEKEILYCDYLEKLLTDVENFRHANVENSDLDSNIPPSKFNNEKKENKIENELEKTNEILEETNALQCINELSSLNMNKKYDNVNIKNDDENKNNKELFLNKPKSRSNSLTDSSNPSHFITVIEVKEGNNSNKTKQTNLCTIENKNDNEQQNDVKHDLKNDTIEYPKASDILNSIQDVKKKVPPRPPPKFIRRSAALEQPPSAPPSSNSFSERNVKPSDIFRKKSTEPTITATIEPTNVVNKTNLESGKQMKSSELVEEFERKIIKSESLERDKRSSGKNIDSPGSLNKVLSENILDTNSNRNFQFKNYSTGSFERSSTHKINDNLRAAESKESIISQGGISDKIKSFESVSSHSNDSLKFNQNFDNEPYYEPYYDTVPIENNDIDFTNNECTTLPLSLPTKGVKSKIHNIEPESPGRNSNYVNIDYFLAPNHETRRDSIDSDIDIEGPPPAIMRHISHDEYPQTPEQLRKLAPADNRNTKIRHIISSIISSETTYVECLNKMVKYMKAINATLTTSQPVISKEEYQTMFFRIEDLYKVHNEFLIQLKNTSIQDDICVGDAFKKLTNNIHLYGAFLHNYGRAIDTVKKCGTNSSQFKNIVSNIVLNSISEQSLSLEDLLHKPVARVQKNALVLQDLLNETPDSHPDYQSLRQSQKIMRNFLSEFNVIQTKDMFPSEDKALRRLVKNSFIVELADGHRKLRHLFLFNDVIACAKYKASGRDRFEFELKWFIPLNDIQIIEESIADPKESSPINILQLKSQACTVRDQIMKEEKDDKKQKFNGSRSGDKHKKKLADLEAQLVLASPNLVFRLRNKSSNKTMTFFLSSDFEKSQWVESIITLQESCNLPGANNVNIYELQAWIAACQTLIKTEMGSYLLRNSRDESLLVGDLHLTIQELNGLDNPADLLICIEIDSYGHYFRKAKTKLICRSAKPIWNESFVIELEGSQNVRVLLYEDHPNRQTLRAKFILKLSRNWLTDTSVKKLINLSDSITLNLILKFIPGEITLRRVPTSKPGALFGAKMGQILKREKRETPFIISACIREVERRGMGEIGIYRVSGSASDLAKLKKTFETNSYEAEQLLKEVDIHSVTGILKSYLRELPEALFTDEFYPQFFDTFNKYSNQNESTRIDALLKVFNNLPSSNIKTINLILEHLVKIHQQELENKMSLHNLAMVFGPTLLRPVLSKQKDLLESSTVVLVQAGILYSFLQAKLNN